MKFISIKTIKESIQTLTMMDMFFGTTFLVFKRDGLPTREIVEFPINLRDREFMDRNYRVNLLSDYYYRPFRLSDKNKIWLEHKYPESGLQSARTRKFKNAFIHESGTNMWAWSEDYISVLKSLLHKNAKISILSLACWILKYESFSTTENAEDIIERFVKTYNISSTEIDTLFYVDRNFHVEFDDSPITWSSFSEFVTPPPDQEQSMNSNLSFFQLESVGGIRSIKLEPGERINIFAGDNSIGKTLLLDSLFWSISGVWSGYPAEANTVSPVRSKFVWQIASNDGIFEFQALFNQSKYTWDITPALKQYNGTVIYFKSDSSTALYNILGNDVKSISVSQLMHGYTLESGDRTQYLLNGIIMDVANWFTIKDNRISIFNKILLNLSPSDAKIMRVVKVENVSNDARPMPFIRMPYATVPINQLSAGIKKIICLAYVITLTIELFRNPKRDHEQIIFIMDEIEAHLHPNWQRLILPSIIKTFSEMLPSVKVQYFISTHSALVTTSLEPYFNLETDKLFHFSMGRYNPATQYSEIEISEVLFDIKGKAETWYTSEYFGLKSTRSIEGERAVENAMNLMRSTNFSPSEVESLSAILEKLVGFNDEFWPRWLSFKLLNGMK